MTTSRTTSRLLFDSAETPRITVRVVKLDDPKDWPAPPPTQERKKPKKPRREFHMCA